MQFTRFTDLGLRVAMQLAAVHMASDGPSGSTAPAPRITAAGVSEMIDASPTHVAKVVSRLVDLGVARSMRGRTGGIMLNPEALDYPLGTLVQQLEGTHNVLATFRGDPSPLDENCRLINVLSQAQEDFFLQLNRLTIRDIAQDVPAFPGREQEAEGSPAVRAATGAPEVLDHGEQPHPANAPQAGAGGGSESTEPSEASEPSESPASSESPEPSEASESSESSEAVPSPLALISPDAGGSSEGQGEAPPSDTAAEAPVPASAPAAGPAAGPAAARIEEPQS